MLKLMTVNSCSRTFMSIIGGVIAGVLGFTSLMGFVFYFLVMAITSVGLAAKAGFSVHSYFDSWNRIILDGFLGGLMVQFYTLQFLCYMCFVICLKISSNSQFMSFELMRLKNVASSKREITCTPIIIVYFPRKKIPRV